MATNTYVAIETKTVTSNVTAVTFSSIPQTYTDLVLVASPKTDSLRDLNFRLGNGSLDTGSNYSSTALWASTSTTGSNRQSNSNYMYSNYYAGATANIENVRVYHFNNYSNTTTYKTVLMRSSTASAGVDMLVGTWRSTSAINTISMFPLSGDIVAGSTFTLYGIAAQAIATTAKATGGTISYDSFGNVVHTFTSSGTFTPSVPLTCDYLVVAGGGGGGYQRGGGGGAGGFRTSTGLSVTATAYTITVGAGGAGDTNTAGAGTNGSDSVFSTITSTGGGGGGSNSGAAANGGSGGGGGLNPSGATFGTGTSGQGNNGGATNATQNSAGCAGGGGGAGAVGNNGSTSVSGNGGAGTASSYSGSLVTYAGGGGGGSLNTGTAGSGGTGGGGAGGLGDVGFDATANTGGGGGGGGQSGSFYPGGAGGSGIVIIRYPG